MDILTEHEIITHHIIALRDLPLSDKVIEYYDLLNEYLSEQCTSMRKELHLYYGIR